MGIARGHHEILGWHAAIALLNGGGVLAVTGDEIVLQRNRVRRGDVLRERDHLEIRQRARVVVEDAPTATEYFLRFLGTHARRVLRDADLERDADVRLNDIAGRD